MEKKLIWAFLLLACVTVSSACSCSYNSDHYCNFDLMFKGKVLKRYKELEGPFDQFGNWIYTVRVKKRFKVPDSLKGVKKITLKTPVGSSLCGITIPLRQTYAFLASWDEKAKIGHTNSCARNSAWKYLSRLLKRTISGKRECTLPGVSPFPVS